MSEDVTNNEGNSQDEPTTQPVTTSATTPATTQQATSANDGGANEQPATTDERTFTQGDVDKIAGKARTQALKKFAKELGLGGVAELEAAVKAKQEAEEAEKSELQKAQEAKHQAELEAAAAIEVANEKLIRAAFLAEAGKVQAKHPQDAYLLADLSEVEITDDGQVTGAEDAVKALVESGRLVVTGKPTPPNLDGGAGSGDRSDERPIKLSQEEIEQARKLKVTPEDYQKFKS